MKFQENLRQRYLSSNEAQNSRKIGFITKIYDNNNIHLNSFHINQHKVLIPNLAYDEDPWFANLSNQQIDPEIRDSLRLGHNFYNPNFATKNQ